MGCNKSMDVFVNRLKKNSEVEIPKKDTILTLPRVFQLQSLVNMGLEQLHTFKAGNVIALSSSQSKYRPAKNHAIRAMIPHAIAHILRLKTPHTITATNTTATATNIRANISPCAVSSFIFFPSFTFSHTPSILGRSRDVRLKFFEQSTYSIHLISSLKPEKTTTHVPDVSPPISMEVNQFRFNNCVFNYLYYSRRNLITTLLIFGKIKNYYTMGEGFLIIIYIIRLNFIKPSPSFLFLQINTFALLILIFLNHKENIGDIIEQFIC